VKRWTWTLVGAILTLGWGGCRSSPAPERLFSEADRLQLKYEKASTEMAIAKYRQAIGSWERHRNTESAARAWQRVGAAYERLGSLDESLRAYKVALSLVRNSPSRLLESDIESDVGVAQANVANGTMMLQDARAHCERAFALAKEADGRREAGKALICLGEVSYFLQDQERALSFYREAGVVFSEVGDDRGIAQSQLDQGHAYSDLRRFDDAQNCLERAEELWDRVGDKRQLAIARIAKARLDYRRGSYQKALNGFQLALASLETIGDTIWEGSSLTGIAWVYEEMADTAAAIKHRERALQLYENAGLKIFAVEVRASLGGAYLASGDQARALDQFKRVLALSHELGIERWEARALRYIGVVHLVRRQPDRSRQYFERAVEVQRRARDTRLDGLLDADLGEMLNMERRYESASSRFVEALTRSRAGGDRVTEARALFGLATSSYGLGQFDRAKAHIEGALSAIESLRTEVESRDLRASFVASNYGYHELHLNVLARLHQLRPGEGLSANAFEAAERARARSLIESLTESGIDLREGVDGGLLEREKQARWALEEWARRSRQLSGQANGKSDTERLAVEYRDLEERYSQIQAEIRSRSPRYAALARPQPLSLKEIQQQILDRDTVLLEYALGEERSYLWTVSTGHHTMHELPARAAIEQAARRVHERLTARLSAQGSEQDRLTAIEAADREYWQDAARLSDMLLGPISKAIAGKRLLVVTDGILQYVPFAALPVPRPSTSPVPMLVEHEIVNLPSASVLAVLRRESARRAQPPKTVAVLADPVFESDDPRLRGKSASTQPAKPDAVVASSQNAGAPPQTLRALDFIRDGRWNVPRLAATRQEADAIVAAVPPEMSLKKIGFDASRATALGPELAQYRIVHFATHGVVDNENPGLSGLILSLFDERGQPQDGFLRLHDIYTLQLPAELIVLSACNTALGKQLKGEGLMGMVRGFLYAGGQRVVASLWKVDDEATSELMRRFYGEMLKNHHSPAAALRQAQMDMWKQDRWKPAFYWAAFSIQGEWK
jgi:CHAT domain-containing protein/tetratricopeptide (TPR) repeat protein